MTQVEIYNYVFTALGLERVSSVSENDKCLSLSAIWDLSRDEVLMSHDWNFATEIQALSVPAVDNLTGYDYVYQLPVDPYCLKIQMLMDSDGDEYPEQPYKIMRRYLYTDLEDVYLKYTFRSTIYDDWPAAFGVFFAYYLAAKAAMKLKQDAQLETQLYGLAELYKRRAIYAEEDEVFVDTAGDTLWVDNR